MPESRPFRNQHVQFEQKDVNAGLTFRLAKTEQDLKDSVDFFFDVFLKGEPITVFLGGFGNERDPAMVEMFEDIVLDGLTVIAVEDRTGRIVGSRVGNMLKRTVPTQGKATLKDLEAFPEVFSQTIQCLESVIHAGEVFDAYPEVDTLYSMFSLGVSEDFRGKGLATRLGKMALKVAIDAGCQATYVVTTNNFTYRLFKKIGLTQYRVMQWKDVEIEGGKKIFDGVGSDALVGHYGELKKLNLD